MNTEKSLLEAKGNGVLADVSGLLPLTKISDEHAIHCANIAGIKSDYEFERFGGRDNGSITIKGQCKKAERTLKIYFSGANTRCLHNGFEVIEYCFPIYDYLRSVGYDVEPHKGNSH